MHLRSSQPRHKQTTRPPFVIDARADSALPTPATLQAQIDQLEPWQSPLLEYLTQIEAESRLHHLLTQTKLIIIEMASDGGAREDLRSSGWELAIEQEILWQCKGQTVGLLPGSFRAKSYGMLSALLLINTYCQQDDLQLNKMTMLKFFCDSTSLLKRIARTQNRSWINPTNCLASDLDLKSAIVEMILFLPLTIRFIHVKSHQDDDTKIHLLPWEAQMNVHAGRLATDYLDNYADPSKLIPFI